jgi:hypothetical protein
MRRINPLLVGGLGVAVAAFWQRKTIMLFGSKVVDAAHESIFASQLPSYARPYAPIILRVSREEGVDPFLIYGLGDRESRWGTALDADGRGDNGHGHGIMQIDDRSFGPWLAANNWRDPYTNVKQGARILRAKLAFFTGRSKVQGYTDGTYVTIDKSAPRLGVTPGKYPDPRPLSGSALWEAGIAAYNTGEGNVIMNLAAGKPAELGTTGGNYVTNVIARANAVAKKYDAATV